MPSVRNRLWDGRIRLFNSGTGKIYLGLLPYVQKFCEEQRYKIAYEESSQYGTVEDKEKKEVLNNYMVLYRLAPITHRRIIEFILDHNLQRWFKYLPQTPIIIVIDCLVSYIRRDYWAIYAIKSVYWELWARVDRNFFNRINTPKGPSERQGRLEKKAREAAAT